MLISCLKCYRFFILYIDITFFGGSCGHDCNMHCIAKKKQKTKKTKKPKNTKKKNNPHNELWVMSFLLVMIAPFIDGMKEERKLLSLYNFISLGISFNYLY